MEKPCKINLFPYVNPLPYIQIYLYVIFLITQYSPPNTKDRSQNDTTNVIPKQIPLKSTCFPNTYICYYQLIIKYHPIICSL